MSFPDAVALVRDYLDAGLTVPVVSRVPDPRPSAFVQLRRVGGARLWPVRDAPRLDVWSWAQTEEDAHDLCMQTRTLLCALPGTTLLGPGVTCYRLQEFLGPTQADDDKTGQPRYWMTVTLTLRAE